MEILTASGKVVTVPAAVRLEAPVYAFVVRQAEAEQVSISTYLKRIILKEIGPKLPPTAASGAGG